MEHIDDIKQEINDWNNFAFARQKVVKEEEQREKHKEHLKRLKALHKQARR